MRLHPTSSSSSSLLLQTRVLCAMGGILFFFIVGECAHCTAHCACITTAVYIAELTNRTGCRDAFPASDCLYVTGL